MSIGYVGRSTAEDEPLGSLTFNSPYGKEIEFIPDDVRVPPYFQVRNTRVAGDQQRVDIFLLERPPGEGLYEDSASFAFSVGGSSVERVVPIVGYLMKHSLQASAG